MTCITPKLVWYIAGLAVLLVFSAKADAQFLSPSSGIEPAADHADALPDSWVPYQAELSEVASYLRAALNTRVGIPPAGYTSGSRISSDTGVVSNEGASGPAIPQDKVELNWLDLFRTPLPAADTGSAGGTTSSSGSPERTNNAQIGLIDRQQTPSTESVTWLAAENQVLPGTPPSARLFRPPRAAA